MQKDWTGNAKSTFTALGASNHSDYERPEHDFYATTEKAAELLLEIEPQLNNIWEGSCGQGHLAKVFDAAGRLGKATDLIDRGYGVGGVDFLKEIERWSGDLVHNPPYKFAQEFIEKSLELVDEGRYVCMFLKLTFAEGKKRRAMFKKYPPIRVWVSSSRLSCARNGEFEKFDSSAACYAWFIWKKGYQGPTELKWFN